MIGVPAGTSADREMRVAHLVDTYLAPSLTWLHPQMVGVNGAHAVVIAQRVVSGARARFPVEDLVALDRHTRIPYWFGRLGLAFGARLTARLARAALSRAHATIAHAHFGHVAWQYLPAARALGLPLITSFYGVDVGRLPRIAHWRHRYEDLFAYGTRFLCEGPAMAAELAALGCPSSTIALQPLGIDTTRFAVVDRVRAPGQPLRVIAAGRFTPKKGLPDAVAAVARAAETVDIRLTIVGSLQGHRRGDREESARILAAVRRLGGERVELAGWMDHAAFARRSHEFDVVLQPSRRAPDGDTEGGVPVGLIEMVATGLPAVATRHGDIPEVVVHEQTGLLAEEGDIDAMAAHLVRLARDPALAATLGANGVVHVRRHFDRTVCLARLRHHYLEVADNPRSSASTPRESRR